MRNSIKYERFSLCVAKVFTFNFRIPASEYEIIFLNIHILY